MLILGNFCGSNTAIPVSAQIFIEITGYLIQIRHGLELLERQPGQTKLSTFIKQWQLLCEKPPKGFEKYFPNAKKGDINEGGKSEAGKKQQVKGDLV